MTPYFSRRQCANVFTIAFRITRKLLTHNSNKFVYLHGCTSSRVIVRCAGAAVARRVADCTVKQCIFRSGWPRRRRLPSSAPPYHRGQGRAVVAKPSLCQSAFHLCNDYQFNAVRCPHIIHQNAICLIRFNM